MHLFETIHTAIRLHESLVCMGLDPDPTAIARVTGIAAPNYDHAQRFLYEAIGASAQSVAGYKLNKAFFDVWADGPQLLRSTIAHIRRVAPQIPVIVDCKVGDTPNTMRTHYRYLFEIVGADAVLVNPYMGPDVWEDLGRYPGRGAAVLVRSSNPSACVLQDLMLPDQSRLWHAVLRLVVTAAAVSPLVPVLSMASEEDAKDARRLTPDGVPVLYAGIGAQGGRLGLVRHLLNSKKGGVLVSSSRALLYPPTEPGESVADAQKRAVQMLRHRLNEVRYA